MYLSLNGKNYTNNNSHIHITEIGRLDPNETSNALQCVTERRPCCKKQRIGEWHFPNMSAVPILAYRPNQFYRNRGDDGTINLNRVSDSIMTPTGLFCCEIFNTNNFTQRFCANIGEVISFQLI